MFRALVVFLFALWPTLAFAAPDTVAVLYFQNQGNPDLEPLKVGLAQMLITDLTGVEGVTVVERQQLQAILDELDLGHKGVVDKKTAAKVGELLGAQYILMGGYFELVGTLRIDARLVKVQTGEIVHAHGVNGKTDQFMALEKQLARDFRVHLSGGQVPDEPGDGVDPDKKGGQGASGTRGGEAPKEGPTGAPPTEAVAKHDADEVQAALAYSEGLIFMDKKDPARARESFEKAVAANPDLTLAKAELASLEL